MTTVFLRKDYQELWRCSTRRTTRPVAWRLIDSVTGIDMVQPWFNRKPEALEFAKQRGWSVEVRRKT